MITTLLVWFGTVTAAAGAAEGLRVFRTVEPADADGWDTGYVIWWVLTLCMVVVLGIGWVVGLLPPVNITVG